MAGIRMRWFQKTGSASIVNRAKRTRVVSGLISLQDWDKLRVLLSSEVNRSAVIEELQSSEDFLSASALNFACRFHPPLDVVRAFAALSPEMLVKSDSMGRSPLHIAAKWGACPQVICFLAESHPASIGNQDFMGKTPLHVACESYSLKYSSCSRAQGRPRPLKEAILEVVRSLCEISPTTVNLEDNEEMTALEYAIEAELDFKVVRTLQKACEKDGKRRRKPKKGAMQKHEDAQQTLKIQQSQRSTLQQQPQQRSGLDISAVGAALSSLEPEKMRSSSQGPVAISHPRMHPREKTLTRAVAA